MQGTVWLLLLNSATPLKEAALREVRRLLGPDVAPLMAWPTGAAIAFISADPPRRTVERLRDAIGDRTEIAVLALGTDHELWGAEHHHLFLKAVQRLANRSGQKH